MKVEHISMDELPKEMKPLGGAPSETLQIMQTMRAGTAIVITEPDVRCRGTGTKGCSVAVVSSRLTRSNSDRRWSVLHKDGKHYIACYAREVAT